MRTLLLILCLAVASSTAAAPGDVYLSLPDIEPSRGTQFDVEIVVETGAAVLGGYELQVDFDTTELEFVSASPGTVPEFVDPIRFSADEVLAGALRFGAYQGMSDTAPSGTLVLGTLTFKALAPPGSSTLLELSVLKLMDPDVDDLPALPTDATVVINLLPLGDVNGDGVPNQVSDAVFLTRALLGTQSLTDPQRSASDVNGDGTPESVADLVWLVNVLTGQIDPIGKSAPAGEIIAGLGSPEAEGDWLLLPVELDSDVPLGGALVALELDAAAYELGAPRLAPRASRMQVGVGERDGRSVVLVYSHEGSRIDAGAAPLLWLPVRVRNRRALESTASSAIRLESVQLADTAGRSAPVELDEGHARVTPLPARLALHPNVPNPFNPRTQILFDLPQNTHAKLMVYDTAGRRIRVLVDHELTAGHYAIPWDGTDGRGVAVASGVYYARLVAPGAGDARQKMVLLR